MLDLNHICLFIACASPLILLAQGWSRGGMDRSWRLAAIAVLLVTGFSWIWRPETAGFVGGGAWCFLLLLPAVGLRKAAEFAGQQRYASARRVAGALRILHPAANLRAQSHLLRAMELAQRGDFTAALVLLKTLQDIRTIPGRQAIAQSLRIQGDWSALLRWLRFELPPEILRTDLALQPLYLRALGETGARDELFLEFVERSGNLDSAPQYLWLYDVSLLVVLAFGGRREEISKLVQSRLHKLSHDMLEFWTGTGELAAGEIVSGRARLEKLRASTSDALIRVETVRRLEQADELAGEQFSPGTDTRLRRIATDVRPAVRLFGARTAMPTVAVLVIIALNVAMFVAELALGGSTNPFTLHYLGALDLFSVRFAGEYWRLLSSLFLHYGALHLLFNLYALFIIGPGLEKAIGAIRFGICYLLSGLGSSVGVLILHLAGLSRTEQLVGASGCVMGLVGVWAGLLLRHRNVPFAVLRLQNILLIVAVQIAFDLSTPQISMAAHLSGLVTGVALGLIISPRTLPE